MPCASMRAITRPRRVLAGFLMFFDLCPEVEDLSAQAQATAAQHLAGVERQDLSRISCRIVQRFAVRDLFECVFGFRVPNIRIW